MLMEYDPNPKSAEERAIEQAAAADAAADAAEKRAAEAKAKAKEHQDLINKADDGPTEQGFNSAKEAAKYIEDQETLKQRDSFTGFQDSDLEAAYKELGFTQDQVRGMDASNFRRFTRQVRGRASKKQEQAAMGDRQSRADKIKADIENKTYKLSAEQQRRYDKEGTRYLDRLAYGLAGREQEKASRDTRQGFYRKTSDEMRKYDRGAEGIIRRREMEGTLDDINIGGAAEQYVRFRESDAAKTKAMFDRQAAAERASRERAGAFGSSMSDDELLSLASQKGMTVRPGDQVRAFDELKRRQQQSISSFGQQMSGLRPETQDRIQAAMRRGLSSGQAAQEELKRKQRLGVGQLNTATAREAASRQTLNSMEAAARAKREQSATQAIQDILGRFQ